MTSVNINILKCISSLYDSMDRKSIALYINNIISETQLQLDNIDMRDAIDDMNYNCNLLLSCKTINSNEHSLLPEAVIVNNVFPIEGGYPSLKTLHDNINAFFSSIYRDNYEDKDEATILHNIDVFVKFLHIFINFITTILNEECSKSNIKCLDGCHGLYLKVFKGLTKPEIDEIFIKKIHQKFEEIKKQNDFENIPPEARGFIETIFYIIINHRITFNKNITIGRNSQRQYIKKSVSNQIYWTDDDFSKILNIDMVDFNKLIYAVVIFPGISYNNIVVLKPISVVFEKSIVQTGIY